MLKATVKSSYRKATSNGSLQIFVYDVTGTKAEISAYKEAQMNTLNIDDVADLPGAKEGACLFFLPKLNGTKIRSQFNLLITTNGRIVVDNTAETVAEEMAIDAASIGERAKIRAELAEGVRTLAPRNGVPVAAPAKVVTAANPLDLAIDAATNDNAAETDGEGHPEEIAETAATGNLDD